MEFPWELLLATTEACSAGRHDVVQELLARHSGLLRGGAVDRLDPITDVEAARWIRSLTYEVRGHLRGRVLIAPTGWGMVEWVLHDSGWRDVQAVVRDGWPTARLVPVHPHDLARRVADLVTGASA